MTIALLQIAGTRSVMARSLLTGHPGLSASVASHVVRLLMLPPEGGSRSAPRHADGLSLLPRPPEILPDPYDTLALLMLRPTAEPTVGDA